ncbi:MAG: XdhC family protein [Candidatus Latescibacterota bacterium]|nr:XdhC family protein [Candidatus Latescibacterota bacterium]
MGEIIDKIARETNAGRSVVMASLVWSTGSIPMSQQARLVVFENGETVGTIGGGCLEAEIYESCQSVLNTEKAERYRYTMTEKQAGEDGLNCGGSVEIFIEKISGKSAGIFNSIQKLIRDRCTFYTVVGLVSSKRVLIDQNGNVLCNEKPDIKIDIARQLGKKGLNNYHGFIRKSESVNSEEDVFVEPFFPKPKLYVFGGGHVGAQVGQSAKNIGFHVVILDDRPQFANEERHPYADEFHTGQIQQIFSKLHIDENSYVLAVTRGHQHDEQVVEWAVKTSAFFIGMLGSERKKKILWKKLLERGNVSKEDLLRVSSPVGINIGADNPEEIAISILAELIRVRRGVKREWKTKKGF